ncbi:hypothetical protein F383_11164 [Gossypium arboreum]|uniref:Uncharacterized protein n=1 Tax=Gossypium arboreum TaxID=29729 RepID=A0A0B0PWA4_GOSAR|nr:hypothetical protein F383_11164 [Gossypium arboreum]
MSLVSYSIPKVQPEFLAC